MNTVKILHCADVHIGAAESFLGAGANERRYETLVTFERIIDTAKENDVRVIAIAGDLFDSNKIESSFFRSVFDKIASVPDIKVIFAAGNHDPLNTESPFVNYRLPQNLYVLGIKDDCLTFDDLKLRVYGRSFENVYLKGEDCFSIIPPDDEYINLCVIHGELKSDLNSDYNSITPGFITHSKMDYIALGHIHRRTEIGKIGDTYFAYSGCPEGQGFDELDDKGIYIGEIGNGYCNLEFMPVAKRRHIFERIDISGCDNSSAISEKILDCLKEKYQNTFKDNLYKIELIGNIPQSSPVNIPEILSRISTLVYFIKIKDNTEFIIDYNSLSGEVSLKGIFVKNMLNKIENSSEAEQQELKKALTLGLKAFSSEVMYNED